MAVWCMCKKMERANKHTVINMEMNNKLKLITYNYEHVVCNGLKFPYFVRLIFCFE